MTMASLTRKCLNAREESFAEDHCPCWLSSILPSRLQSAESAIDHDHDDEHDVNKVDLDPYKFTSRFLTLTDERQKSSDEVDRLVVDHYEYPHRHSFVAQQLQDLSQLIFSPSNEQLMSLCQRVQRTENKSRSTDRRPLVQHAKKTCDQVSCVSPRIPFSSFCKFHLVEKDNTQVLLTRCCHCDEITVRDDKRHLLHFCSSSSPLHEER